MSETNTNIKKLRGDFGENAVCEYLENRGYKIIARNFRKPFGEIDIIALHNGEVAFVEVKSRKFESLTDGADAVNRDKRRKIVRTARAFLSENGEFRNMNARFDVASVVLTTEVVPRVLELEYFEDAFEAAYV